MAEEPYNPSPIGNPSVLARRNWWQFPEHANEVSGPLLNEEAKERMKQKLAEQAR